MKVHIASDFHMEFTPHWTYKPPKADLTVIAGDVATNGEILYGLKKIGYSCPVVSVLGNHDYYHGNLDKIVDAVTKEDKSNYYTLEMGVKEFDDVVVLGATLWTDFNLYGTRQESELKAQRSMADYLAIRIGAISQLCAYGTTVLHDLTVNWLDEELPKHAAKKRIVVTHHAPHPNSISPRFQGHELNPAFVSDLSWLIEKHSPNLWVHGHVHSSHDYMVGKTRIVANPRGYPEDRFGFTFENKGWNPGLIVEI